MKNLFAFAFIICMMATLTSNSQKLDKFGADMGKKSVMGKDIRVPYTDVITYYGYIKPGTAPDETRDGKNYYYLYMWIPAVAPEMGVRMASPVDKMTPGENDIVSPLYTENTSDKTNFFDTWVSLEHAIGVTSTSDITTKGKT